MWQQKASDRTGEGWGDGCGASCVQPAPHHLLPGWGGVQEAGPSSSNCSDWEPGLLSPRQQCRSRGADCLAAFSDIQDVHILSGFVRDHLPDLQPEPAVMEHCMYTVSVGAAGPGSLPRPWEQGNGAQRPYAKLGPDSA